MDARETRTNHGAVIPAVQKPREPRSCNRHADCDAADAKYRALLGYSARHCHVEDCEDCYGQ
jgi:hypothetical protein